MAIVQKVATCKKKKKKKKKPQPNIYFAPWTSGAFSFSASLVVCSSAEGCGPEIVASTEEGTLFEEGVSLAVAEVVGALSLDAGGWAGWAGAAMLGGVGAGAFSLMARR